LFHTNPLHKESGMNITQCTVGDSGFTESDLAPLVAAQPQLVLVFGSLAALDALDMALLHRVLPGAQWVGCSTAGEISNRGVADDTLVSGGGRTAG
jgi:hypothetical protein